MTYLLTEVGLDYPAQFDAGEREVLAALTSNPDGSAFDPVAIAIKLETEPLAQSLPMLC